jgi:poly-gamma-glutamate synthase PgsB/CapB
MFDLLVPAAMTAAGLAGLGWEASRLSALRRRIPLRIGVTGTRGKSSVTRLVAAALRADGRTVVAKTTGSRPVLILPDGLESNILRPGPPTILEQKAVLRAAARIGASTLVAEMMSIGPEALQAEAGKILRPHILIVTNVRLDHRFEMGRTREAIAATLARAFVQGATVLLLEEEMFPVFTEAAARMRCCLSVVPAPWRRFLREPGPSTFPPTSAWRPRRPGFAGSMRAGSRPAWPRPSPTSGA